MKNKIKLIIINTTVILKTYSLISIFEKSIGKSLLINPLQPRIFSAETLSIIMRKQNKSITPTLKLQFSKATIFNF